MQHRSISVIDMNSDTEKTPNKQPELAANEVKSDTDGQGEEIINEQEIPDHFYDSDLASVNQKDFLSDNEPPKDQIQQRKLLYKQKMLHVFKTIVRIGNKIDKPAAFDRIKLKFKQVPTAQVLPKPLHKPTSDQPKEENYPEYFSSHYLMDQEEIEYNVGKDHFDIERLVTSMKRQETAVFELEYLQTSKKSNIKIRTRVDVFVIATEDWTTVIDMDCDGKYMKEVLQRGQGHHRIGKHDEVSYKFDLKRGNSLVLSQHNEDPIKLEDNYINNIPKLVWKVLHSMKTKQRLHLTLTDAVVQQCEGEAYAKLIQTEEHQPDDPWDLTIEVFYFHNVDDVFMDGRLLKKQLLKGVSTAKPESSSQVYLALKFLGPHRQVLAADACFNSDWWQDFGHLDQLGCRKYYLDDFSVSEMLKHAIKRMKPAEIAQIECRDKSLFAYGQDHAQYLKLTNGGQLPDTIYMIVRVYNFTEGQNCFNMELDQKIAQSKRKKAIAVKLLKQNKLPKALKTFENIVAYYGSGQINQQAYDQKIAALMNSILCHMKNQNYQDMIKLCDSVLQIPKHGYDIAKMKINGPMNPKVEGMPEEASDFREEAGLTQNQAILDKCLYRKAYALIKLGEGDKALQTLALINTPSEQVAALVKQAQKTKENYQKKSAKMYKNMFG